MVGRPRHMGLTRKITALAATSALLAAAPATALAQNPTQTGYNSIPSGVTQIQLKQPKVPNTPGTPSAQVNAASSSPTSPSNGSGNSSLPFTGLDVGLAVGAGAILLALGLGVRRLSRTGGVA